MEGVQEIKLNQPAMCPWTSTAPLQSVTSSKLIDGQEEIRIIDSPDKVPNEISAINNANTTTEETRKNEDKQSTQRPDTINIKQSSSQFFHFLRLMQLFPNVHPATLHTVMILCKNDFFVAVDKLLYAKRCKELYQNRRHLFQNFTNKGQRYAPYTCNGTYCQNVNCIKPQVIKLDSKKMVSRNRYSKDATPSSSIDLSPVTLQCTVPIQPLSPASAEDLSAPTVANIEVVLQK